MFEPDREELRPLTGTRHYDKKVKFALYVSYMMAAWAWRTWEFTIALLLIELRPDSLLLVSIYGLLDNVTRVMIGASVGSYLDRTSRLGGATLMYLIQNACIAMSALCVGVLLIYKDLPLRLYWALMSACIVLGSLSGVGSLGLQVSVEKEWPRQLYGKEDPKVLAGVNSVMRAIDLLCLLLAPLLSGVLMTYLKPIWAVAAIAGYTLLAWVPELLLIRGAVSASPVLAKPREQRQAAAGGGFLSTLVNRSAWRVYLRQPVLLPSVALALLYCTVLSLGFLMTSYLRWSGLTEAQVSVYRGIGALTGLLATYIFPVMSRWLRLSVMAVLGISFQLACLACGVLPALMAQLAGGGGAPTTVLVHVLVAGVVASRTGLWLFDLAVTQLQQTMVAEGELSTVGGVQGSLSASFEMISFLAGAALSRPQQFIFLMGGSLGMVATAATLAITYAMCGGDKVQGGDAAQASGTEPPALAAADVQYTAMAFEDESPKSDPDGTAIL